MKTALITGVSKGIGLALAQKFLAEGFDVIGTVYAGSRPEKNENLLTLDLDLSSSQSIADCVAAIVATGKKIDVLVNNAGAQFDTEDTSVIVDKLRKTLEVNLVGTIDFTERIIPAMSQDGHIVNISSTAGSLELAGQAASHYPYHYPSYKISKAALNMYTRTLALRLKPAGIIVSSVHPGWVKTDMGGEEADMTTEEAANGIYGVSVSRPETGGFWFKGKAVPW